MSKLLRATPSEVGIPSESINAMLNFWAKNNIRIHSFMLLRHGKVAAEGYYAPFAPNKRHQLYSLSKSFTSTACAFAFEEGLFTPEDKLVDIFSEYKDCACENLSKMRIKHLLSMCTGHKPSADFIFENEDCVKAFMTSDVPFEPGSFFAYNTGATYMCSAIIQKLTGVTLYDYLTPRLFKPLGINGAYWDSCEKGINYGGFGLNIKTEDIAKFGQFLLQKGYWDGVQLLPEHAIDEMTRKRINNCGDATEYKTLDDAEHFEVPANMSKNDWACGYSRQFWRCSPENVYRGDGKDGQLCIVMPDQDAVMAITAGTNNMQGELDGIWQNIVPEFDKKCDAVKDKKLAKRLAGLSMEIPKNKFVKPDYLNNQIKIKFDKNKNNIKFLTLDFGETVKLRMNGTANVGIGKWADKGMSMPVSNVFSHVSCAGGWSTADTFTIHYLFDRTPYGSMISIKFKNSGEAVIKTIDFPYYEKETIKGTVV